MDQASLLEQLRIERPVQEAPRRATWRWSAAVAVAVIAVGAAAYVWLPRAVPIQVAVAEPVSETAAAPSSILDASGYVVARRQATVSAKITGKVVDGRASKKASASSATRSSRDSTTRTRRATVAQARARARAKQGESRRGGDRVRERDADVRAQRAAVRARRHQRADVRHGEGQLRRGADGLRRRRARGRSRGGAVWRSPSAIWTTPSCARRSPESSPSRRRRKGEMVSPMSAGGGFTRTGIGTIVDMSSLEVEVDVSENFINRVVPQQPVTVSLNAYPDWTFPARVIAIIPTADRAKATVKVRVGFDVDGRADPAGDGRARGVPRSPTAPPARRRGRRARSSRRARAEGGGAGRRRHRRRFRRRRRRRRAAHGAARRAERGRASRACGSRRRVRGLLAAIWHRWRMVRGFGSRNNALRRSATRSGP